VTDSTNNPPPATPDPAVPPPADPDAPLAGGPDGGGTHGDDPGSPAIPAATASETEPGEMVPKNRQRVGASGVVIALLLALLGFTLVVQVQNNATDKQFSSARQDDLVRLLSDLDALQERQRQDIATLEQTRQELASGAAGREAALNQAGQRADALGILAGTLPAQGPGVSGWRTTVTRSRHHTCSTPCRSCVSPGRKPCRSTLAVAQCASPP
jgi:hypothetical protein